MLKFAKCTTCPNLYFGSDTKVMDKTFDLVFLHTDAVECQVNLVLLLAIFRSTNYTKPPHFRSIRASLGLHLSYTGATLDLRFFYKLLLRLIRAVFIFKNSIKKNHFYTLRWQIK